MSWIQDHECQQKPLLRLGCYCIFITLAGLGVGSGWYIGDGGEYGGGAAGLGGV